MKYTAPIWERKGVTLELNRIKKEPFDIVKCTKHPSYFVAHMLGIIPYKYQHMFLRQFAVGEKIPKRIIICKARQMGFSYFLAFLAIWYAFGNIAKTGMHNDTKVGIISRSDKQAKKLMALIQKVIRLSKVSLNFAIDKKAPWNKYELHFTDGFIKCFPPTDACRGETFDILIVDEARGVEKEIFVDAMEPTVSAVDGIIIMVSTPRGQKGMFFEIFDPFDIHKIHEYKRYWFNWKMSENEIQKRIVAQKLKIAKETGNMKSFDQEYNALFTVDEEAFFEDADVEKGMDKELTSQYECKDVPCSIGLDYGITTAATCITVVGQFKKTIITLFQFAQVDFDENLLMDKNWENSIPSLKKRYNIKHVVVDKCLEGDTEIVIVEDGTYKPRRISECKKGDIVLSYDFENKEYCHKPIEKQIWKGMKENYKISLRNGTSIQASKNHEWFCKQQRKARGKLQPVNIKPTKDLKLKRYSDKLVSVKQIPHLFDRVEGEGDITWKSNSYHHNAFFYLMGMYIAEGHHHIGENRCYISQSSKKHKPKIRKYLKRLNLRFSESNNGFCILGSLPFIQCGNKSYNKRIPNFVFQLDKESLTYLWGGLIDGDGHRQKKSIDKRGYKRAALIGYSTVNKKLASDIRFLALLLGKPMYHKQRVHSGFGSTKMQYEPVHCENSYFNKEYYPGTSLTAIRSIKHIGYAQMYDIKVKDTKSFVLWESGIITHNCPQGNRTNTQLKNEGYPVLEFSFRSDQYMGERNRGYYLFRTNLKRYTIKYPEWRDLMAEMKALQEIRAEHGKFMKITAPRGYNNDRIDSLMMACYPFLKEEGGFSSTVVDYEKVIKKMEASRTKMGDITRFDSEWEKLKQTEVKV